MLSLKFVMYGTLPGKERPRRGRGGHFYTPLKTRHAEERVWLDFRGKALQWAALNKRRSSIIPEIRKSERIQINLKCFFANKRHPDLDNIQKLVWDALSDHRKGSVLCSKERLGDDKRFSGSADFDFDKENPRTEITISWNQEEEK